MMSHAHMTVDLLSQECTHFDSDSPKDHLVT